MKLTQFSLFNNVDKLIEFTKNIFTLCNHIGVKFFPYE